MKRIKVLLAVVALLAAMMVLAAPAMAQSEIGSFGGGGDVDFGSGSNVDDGDIFPGPDDIELG